MSTVTAVCNDCGANFQISKKAYNKKLRTNSPFRCHDCVYKYLSNINKERLANRSQEERELTNKKISVAAKKRNKRYWENLSEEDRIKRSKRQTEINKRRWANTDPAKRIEIGHNISKGQRQFWENATTEFRDSFSKKQSSAKKKIWANLTDEQRKEVSAKRSIVQKERWESASEEEHKLHSKRQKEIWDSRSAEERKYFSDISKARWAKMNDGEKKQHLSALNEGALKWRESLSPEDIQRLSDDGKARWNSMSDEKKGQTAMSKRLKWEAKSEEEKEKIIQREKDRWANMSPEEKLKVSQRGKALWNSLSEEEKLAVSNREKDRWNNMVESEKQAISEFHKSRWLNMTPEEKEKVSLFHKEVWANLPKEEKDRIRSIISESTTRHWNQMSSEEKKQWGQRSKNYWKNMDPEEKADKIRRNLMTASSANNSLHKRFERTFTESHLVNSFFYVPEYPTINNRITHCWDYGVFNENGDLVCVVDLDGAFFHADICDYDGVHSKEEYDEVRTLSLPDKIPVCIIDEFRFKLGFENLIQTIMLNYDDYIEQIFKECRAMPFPYPHYTDTELVKSWDKLQRMNCNDKYHTDIALNTRQGDRLIQHFHHSIWHEHVAGGISPYEAWQNDDILKDVIRNRIIYQTHLNPNKVLQGFNVSKVAPKVSVFSAGRAKMIINRYLSEFTEVFDPFSGYSGRMLGAISLGKKYIGQDISERHVMESNQLMEFLRRYSVSFDAIITQRNVLDSTGEYQCLLTCPPYGYKEQWENVPIDARSCDDWIDECLHRFKCKRYVFVVDHTTRYRDYIVAELSNKSHLSSSNEYIVIINREDR